MKTKLKQISGPWYFLITVVVVYCLLFIFKQDLFFLSLSFFGKIIYKIIPVFILVFVLMALTNYFITPELVLRYFKGKGIKKWFFVIIGGILSAGPIYMWYPLLAELKEKGLNDGLIACFLYNRAIKIPLLPVFVLYFGVKYILVLSLIMIFTSMMQGLIINKLMEVKYDNCHRFR